MVEHVYTHEKRALGNINWNKSKNRIGRHHQRITSMWFEIQLNDFGHLLMCVEVKTFKTFKTHWIHKSWCLMKYLTCSLKIVDLIDWWNIALHNCLAMFCGTMYHMSQFILWFWESLFTGKHSCYVLWAFQQISINY